MAKAVVEGGHSQCKASLSGKQGDRNNKQDVRCYYCGELGHNKPFCPSRKIKHFVVCYVMFYENTFMC